MYLLTEWEGRTGKYLARGQDLNESQIFSYPARLLAKFTFLMVVACSTLRIGPNLFYIEKFTTQFKITEKNDRSPESIFEEMTIYLYGEVQP